MSPTTDNAPFFYEFNLGLPALLKNLWWSLGVFLLVAIIYLALPKPPSQPSPKGGRSLLSPHRGEMPFRAEGGSYATTLLYFLSLGIGFMLIEAGMLQHLSLFLGHPSLNLSVVLLGLLVSSGLGSWLSQRLPAIKKNAPLIVALLIILQAFALPLILQTALSLPLWGRIALAWLLILPLGIVLGMPFPTGLRQTQQNFVPLTWGVNGVGSVVGAVAAITLAMSFGFQAVFLLGSGIYLLVSVLAGNLWQ